MMNMSEIYKILAINPGSTSTKIAVFDNEEQILDKTLRHSAEEIGQFPGIAEQYEFRKNMIEEALVEAGIKKEDLSAVVGRGGFLKPVEGGTYNINDKMFKYLNENAVHASSLGGIIAKQMGDELGVRSFIVDPVVVDELDDIARISGLADIERISIFHALNQKAIARRYAKEIGKKYEDINVIVAHMGGGVSVGAHLKGRVVEVANGLDGDGPFSPERSGGLPVGEVVKMCFSGKFTQEEISKKLKGKGGINSYLGTTDAREVEAMIEKGDKKAELVYSAMAYQISKEIGACATVLKGQIDGILLTGGISYSNMFTDMIKDRVSFLADVKVFPGEDEMGALAGGCLRVLRGEEQAQDYDK